MVFGWLKYLLIFDIKSAYKGFKSELFNYQNRDKQIKISPGCKIERVEFGTNVYLASDVILKDSTIGNFSYINPNSVVLNTTIGNYCSIGSNVQIVVGVHPTHMVSTHPVFYATNKPFSTFVSKSLSKEYLSVEIGSDVWIGDGALIIGGVKIGHGAVIGARAVVTKDVPPYAIVGGVPAKIIRFRFSNSLIENLLEIEWWNWQAEKIKSQYKLFSDPALFIEENK